MEAEGLYDNGLVTKQGRVEIRTMVADLQDLSAFLAVVRAGGFREVHARAVRRLQA